MRDGIDRIMVIGCGGAGKSTISTALAEHYRLRLVHLDHHFWRPGWRRVDDDRWREIVTELIGQDRWLHDGNYKSTMDVRLPRADLVVFVDPARWRCLWRVLRRPLSRRLAAPGCPHRVNRQFLRYVWDFPRRSRPEILAALTPHADRIPVIRLRNPRQVRDFLADLPDLDRYRVTGTRSSDN